MSARTLVLAPVLGLVLGCGSLPSEPPTQERWSPVPSQGVAAPWTLTASDGSGLELVRVDARAVVEGPLAFTELHLVFHNPEPRDREGTFAIALPPRSAVSRFAMEHERGFHEAEVVPKALARRAYEDFLHRRQDPALLEKAPGNQFTARVFPIGANADKHLVISFSQELAGEYLLPLRGLPSIAQIDVRVDAVRLDGTRATHALHERAWRPDRDFTVGVVGPRAVASGTLVAAQVPITTTTAAADVPSAITLLVDTSASRALGFAAYVQSIGELVTAMRLRYGDGELQVVAFDQETQPIYRGRAAGFGDAQLATLFERGAAGASDLGQALASLGVMAAHRRIVLVTDGVITAGLQRPELVAAAAGLRADRLDVVLAGGIRDERLASSLVRAGLPRMGTVLDLDRGASGVSIGLGEAVLADVAITIPGATWIHPRVLPAVRAGSDPVTVYARMAMPARAIEVISGTERRTLELAPATPAVIQRALAGAEIEELEHRLEGVKDPAIAGKLREDIALRSVAARVISSQTAMLVLENAWDYDRYGIDRKALADILVVGPNGIEQTRRTSIAAADPPAGNTGDTTTMALDEGRAGKPASARGDGQLRLQTSSDDPQLARQQAIEMAREAGILGASGRYASLTATADISTGFDDTNIYGGLVGDAPGHFGYGRPGFGPGGGGWAGAIGSGSGRGGMRGRTAASPSLHLGTPVTQGGLDKAIIRRYLKRNLQKLAYCYEKELLARPSLAGTVVARFAIAATGLVASSTASGLDPAVASCVANVIRGIQFPRPAGTMQVSYPLVFQLPQGQPAPRRVLPQAPVPVPAPATDARTAHAINGKLADVMAAIASSRIDTALAIARQWRSDAPGDVLALVALGEAHEANDDFAAAARMYGSIIDLYPARADFRRFAGERLERVASRVPTARRLAIDTYRRAVADRPDHVTGHRLLAYALLRGGDHAGAFAAILSGFDHPQISGRFRGAERVLAEDVSLIAAAYRARGGAVADELAKRSLEVATSPSTRFVTYWETDANDVDFHIRDAHGGHASYSNMKLASGGELYADVTTGYGPECFTIPGTPNAGPYQLSLHYYAQGPMGFGMGLLQIQRFDGKGGLTFEDRPFVIMNDRATVELGSVK